ncbi:hypothetical protein HELRODRAFT_159369 [Helobdella robusta]|uniref:G-protein coupled receptors family 1 profile domain-containing protein n=1 Tax=Helobdella robusta TaxID=6412 RepID=T1ENY4_HELRO|nr:hypothetical protein HELRODRAFT_159369 [Helobdella robusta]ESO12784.1 hypothetical protein HELRODRAFT_159369 [Helobdella robusta]
MSKTCLLCNTKIRMQMQRIYMNMNVACQYNIQQKTCYIKVLTIERWNLFAFEPGYCINNARHLSHYTINLIRIYLPNAKINRHNFIPQYFARSLLRYRSDECFYVGYVGIELELPQYRFIFFTTVVKRNINATKNDVSHIDKTVRASLSTSQLTSSKNHNFSVVTSSITHNFEIEFSHNEIKCKNKVAKSASLFPNPTLVVLTSGESSSLKSSLSHPTSPPLQSSFPVQSLPSHQTFILPFPNMTIHSSNTNLILKNADKSKILENVSLNISSSRMEISVTENKTKSDIFRKHKINKRQLNNSDEVLEEPISTSEYEENDAVYLSDYDDDLNETNHIETIVVSTVYGLTFLAGSVGNSLVIICILNFRKMRSVTNVFLLSLAFADLLLVFACVPIKVS